MVFRILEFKILNMVTGWQHTKRNWFNITCCDHEKLSLFVSPHKVSVLISDQHNIIRITPSLCLVQNGNLTIFKFSNFHKIHSCFIKYTGEIRDNIYKIYLQTNKNIRNMIKQNLKKKNKKNCCLYLIRI